MKKLIMILLTACLLSSCATGSTVATVGDIKITKGEVEFYLADIKNQMKGTELKTDEDWQSQEIEGKKAIDVAKERALDIAISTARYIEVAKLAGITLDDSEEKAIEDNRKRVIENYGGESAYKQFLKENNITDELVETTIRSAMYRTKIKQKVTEEHPATEADGKAYFEKNNKEFRKAKHILIMTVDEMTQMPKAEEEIAKAKTLADDLLKRAKSGEDFDKLMNEYSEDPGLSSNPDGYVFGSGEMVPEFEQATDSVGVGEIAFCESSYGYHIIKREAVSYEEVQDRAVALLMEEIMEEKIKEWEDQYSLKIVKNEDVLKEIQ